jgi:hypothetical protein
LKESSMVFLMNLFVIAQLCLITLTVGGVLFYTTTELI